MLHTPDHFQCDSDGFHADHNDCSIFFRCIDWGESSENSLQPRYTSFKFQCGDGTVFDIESSNCVHVEETSRLECRQYIESDPYARISERDSADSKQVDYGVEEPSSGYNPPNQPPSYNRPSTGGQTPGDSGGVDNNIGESSVPPSKSPPCDADGFFPIPNDCEHFYRCVGNGNGFNKYEFSCGPETVWDPDNNACNHRWAVSRTDCRSEGGSETGGSSGGPEISEGSEGGPDNGEGPESPEVGEQVAEPSSSTAAPSTSTTTRPYQPSSTSGSTSSPSQSTTIKSTTTTKRSTTISSTTPLSTTEASPSNSSSTVGSSENGTQPGNSCESEGFFPDEKDCKKFYRCVGQDGKFTKYEFECAEGTVWDVEETTCNYPYAVQRSNCNSSSSESQTSTTADGSSSSASSTSTTSASGSQSSGSTSSSGTSSTSSYTNSSSASTTGQSSSSQTTSSFSQTTSSQQTSSSSSTTSSQSTSSNQQTTNNQQSTSSSNSTSSQNGTTPLTTVSPSSSNNGSQSKDDNCTEEGFFPSSKNCNKFYRCVPNEGNGFTKYEFNCGPGTVWDPENNVCNHPWAVKDEKCRSGGQGTTPVGESQTSESTTSSSSTDGSSQSSENNTTSTGTTASQTSTTNANTATTAATSNSNSTTTAGTSNTNSTDSASTTPSNGTAYTTESNAISTTTESNATTTESECTNSTTNKPASKIKCEKAGYYPNPDDCKKFYRCVDWDGDKGERFSVYHFNCPEGTIFDPSLNVCNHAESVYPPRNCDGSSGSQITDSTPTSGNGSDNTTTTEPTTSTESSSEPTTLQTTTDSANATEQTTSGNSETTPAITTPSEQTTTAISSTSEKGTEGTTPVTSVGTSTESTTPYTTPSSQVTTTQTTTTEISTTTTSPSNENCPELGPGQFPLVCPTGFRRHPKYCNLFYQCTVSKTMDIKIVTLSCTNGTIYDEKKIQCLPPGNKS